jgi:hypothetical protein
MITRMVDGFTVTLATEGSAEVVEWLGRQHEAALKELATLKSTLATKDGEIATLRAAASKAPELVAKDMAFGDAAARRAAPGSVTELEDEDDPRLAYIRRQVGLSDAFAARNMSTPEQEAAHWSARAAGLRDSGKLKIVTSDKDPRLVWMDSQSGGSILTRRRAV